jgi:hypothetical protein
MVCSIIGASVIVPIMLIMGSIMLTAVVRIFLSLIFIVIYRFL